MRFTVSSLVSNGPGPVTGVQRTPHEKLHNVLDLAARHGDPLFSADSFHPLEKYRALVDHYRERWEHYGHDPKEARVGTGFGGLFVAERSRTRSRASGRTGTRCSARRRAGTTTPRSPRRRTPWSMDRRWSAARSR